MSEIAEPPKIEDKRILLRAESFNAWRAEHDYPRIIKYFVDNLVDFSGWMSEYNIKTEDMVLFGPSLFLGPDNFYVVRGDSGIMAIGSPRFHRSIFDNFDITKNIVIDGGGVQKKGERITSYWEWVACRNKHGDKICITTTKERNIILNVKIGGLFQIGNLPLLDLRKTAISNWLIESNIDLDFCDLSGCVFNFGFRNRFWFSNLKGAEFNGDFSYIDLHWCYCGRDYFSRNLTSIKNGKFKNWIVSNTQVYAYFENCNLSQWRMIDSSIEGMFDKVVPHDFRIEYNTRSAETKSAESYRCLKRLYSEIFEFDSASEMHINEKIEMRKRYADPYVYFCGEFNTWKAIKDIFLKDCRVEGNDWLWCLVKYYYAVIVWLFSPRVCRIYIKYYKKYIFSLLQSVVWGYGEKPVRVAMWGAFLVLVLFPTIYYCYGPQDVFDMTGALVHDGTLGDVIDSVYFSMITFSTLGYGDIVPGQSQAVRIASGIEGLLGIVFMTLIISSFISKTSK